MNTCVNRCLTLLHLSLQCTSSWAHGLSYLHWMPNVVDPIPGSLKEALELYGTSIDGTGEEVFSAKKDLQKLHKL